MTETAGGSYEVPDLVLPGSKPARGPGRTVPIGRHGRPREEIRAIQHDRILDAFVAAVGRVGLAKAYVNDVCSEAKVSTKEFYDVFADKDDCFIVAFDTGARLLFEQATLAYERAEGQWEDRLRATLWTVFTLLAANPAFARLCILESQDAGPAAADRLDGVVRRYRQAFGGGDLTMPPELSAVSSDRFEDILIGGALRPITEYLRQGRAHRLPALVPGVTYFLTLATVGAERAARQLTIANEVAGTSSDGH